jgi:uncharacterized protein (TIGR00251 family)
MADCYRIEGGILRLLIKAVPGSSKNALAGIQAGRLRIKIAAAPEDGRANEELRSFLAKLLGIPKKEVSLAAGEKSRLKTVTLPLSAEEALKNRLSGSADSSGALGQESTTSP